ncbi:MAG: glycosyltransferase family 9 protein [Candidatus Aureabacteria bacterium]|nr:glycosyltransferase family 9 protein [Candidatus Auribacterota bacterium]
MREPNTILVLSLGGLGDFISRWPLWQSLRRSFPRARISYLGYPPHAALLGAAWLCDEALDFNEARWAAGGALPGGTDLIVSVLGVRGHSWVRRLRGKGECDILEIEPFPGEGYAHSVGEHIISQIRSLGLSEPGPTRLPSSDSAMGWACRYWQDQGFPGQKVIAVHVGSGAEWKNWPADRFDQLAASLVSAGMAVIAVSGEAENTIPVRMREGVRTLANLDLLRLAALLSRCDGYVGNDSGVSHLAALTGAPTTVIFGPTDPVVWAPRGERVTVVRHAMPCAPCGEETARTCAVRRCLLEIGMEQVVKTVVSNRKTVVSS